MSEQFENKSDQAQFEREEKIIDAEIIIFGLALGLILVFTGTYFWSQYSKIQNPQSAKSYSKENSDLEGSGAENGSDIKHASDAEAEVSGEISSWKTYNNSEIGYSVKYPPDWTVREYNRYSEVTKSQVRYINIIAPNKKYTFYLGFKKTHDNFAIVDLTGIGAGDPKKIGDITILGQKMSVDGLYYNGEIREVFFNWSEPKWTSDSYQIYAFLDKDGDTYKSGNGIKEDDLALSYAKKILASLAVTSGKEDTASCPSTLDNSEKNIMSDWVTYTDEKNKFSFQHDKYLTVEKLTDDVLNINNKDGSTAYSIRSNVAAAADFYGYKITSQILVKVNCIDATQIVLATDEEQFPNSEKRKMISTQIDRENTRQRLEMNFPNMMSASLESDYFEEYNMVLKSIKFIK